MRFSLKILIVILCSFLNTAAMEPQSKTKIDYTTFTPSQLIYTLNSNIIKKEKTREKIIDSLGEKFISNPALASDYVSSNRGILRTLFLGLLSKVHPFLPEKIRESRLGKETALQTLDENTQQSLINSLQIEWNKRFHTMPNFEAFHSSTITLDMRADTVSFNELGTKMVVWGILEEICTIKIYTITNPAESNQKKFKLVHKFTIEAGAAKCFFYGEQLLIFKEKNQSEVKDIAEISYKRKQVLLFDISTKELKDISSLFEKDDFDINTLTCSDYGRFAQGVKSKCIIRNLRKDEKISSHNFDENLCKGVDCKAFAKNFYTDTKIALQIKTKNGSSIGIIDLIGKDKPFEKIKNIDHNETITAVCFNNWANTLVIASQKGCKNYLEFFDLSEKNNPIQTLIKEFASPITSISIHPYEPYMILAYGKEYVSILGESNAGLQLSNPPLENLNHLLNKLAELPRIPSSDKQQQEKSSFFKRLRALSTFISLKTSVYSKIFMNTLADISG